MVNQVDFFQGIRLIKDEDIVCLDVMMGPQCSVGEIYPIKLKSNYSAM